MKKQTRKRDWCTRANVFREENELENLNTSNIHINEYDCCSPQSPNSLICLIT